MAQPSGALCDLWQEAFRQSDARLCDRHLETAWQAAIRLGRGNRSQRDTMRKPALLQSLDPRWQPMLHEAHQAVLAWYEADLPAARSHFEQLGKHCVALSGGLPQGSPIWSRLLQFHALTWTAACWNRLGRPQCGRQLLRQGEKLVLKPFGSKIPNSHGWFHLEHGYVAFRDKELDVAEQEYRLAEDCFGSVNNSFGLAEIAAAKARLYTRQGRYRPALDQITQSMLWYDRDDVLNRIKALFNRAQIYRYEQRFPDAIRDLESARTLAKQIDNFRWEASICDVLGDIYISQGDLAGAGRYYKSRVLTKNPDPEINLRHRYQMAKLNLAQAQDMPSSVRRDRLLESVHASCTRLIRQNRYLLLVEKARLLEGRAQLAEGYPLAAAAILKKAAQGLRAEGARWYVAEAMLLVGQAYLKAKKVRLAAQALLAGLHSAVDKVQRDRFLHYLRDLHFDAREVCDCIAELLDKEKQLVESQAIYRQSEADLRRLLLGFGSRTMGLGGLPHVRQHLWRLSEFFGWLVQGTGASPTANGDPVLIPLQEFFERLRGMMTGTDLSRAWDVLKEMGELLSQRVVEKADAECCTIEKRVLCEQALIDRWRPPGIPQWVSCAKFPRACRLTLPPRQLARLERLPGLGVFANVKQLRQVFKTALRFMTDWAGPPEVEGLCRLDEDRWLVVRFSALRAALAPPLSAMNDLLDPRSPPETTALSECGVKPEWWPELAWTAIRIRSEDGQIEFLSKGKPTGPRRVYVLEVRLPCYDMPLWEK